MRVAASRTVLGVVLTLGACGAAGCSLLDWSALNAGAADGGGTSPDAATDGQEPPPGGDAAADGGPRCNPRAPFSTPVLLAGPINGLDSNEADGFLTPDELTLYFSRDLGDGKKFDIYVATRSAPDGPFGDAFPVPGLSAPERSEQTPFLSGDRRTMYFASSPIDGRPQIHSAPATDGGFGAATALTALAAVSSAVLDPFFLGDGVTLYFTDGYNAIPMTTKAQGGSFVQPTVVPGLPPLSVGPKVTDDDRTVYFSAPPNGGAETDIYVARRNDPDASFATAERIDELSTAGRDHITWISADGCHALIARFGTKSTDLFAASRGP